MGIILGFQRLMLEFPLFFATFTMLIYPSIKKQLDAILQTTLICIDYNCLGLYSKRCFSLDTAGGSLDIESIISETIQNKSKCHFL